VLLLSDPSCKVAVRLKRSGEFGLAEGQGAQPGQPPAVRADYLLKTADVQPGDEVVTSGLGGLFPKGLPVGRVADVALDASGLYQTARIELAADLGKLEYAFVAATEKDLAAVRGTPVPADVVLDEETGYLEGEDP
jgi:rod shape-determining protein MreC